MSQQSSQRSRILYLPHGGGPMPLLADPGHEKLITFLQHVSERIGTPDAILIISAHWEEAQVTLTSSAFPELIYDYGGFPAESYQIQYPAPGHPVLAQHIATLLAGQSIPVRLDDSRGFDHGMFVPLKLMYPAADIPCLQLSLHTSLDAQFHLTLGKCLSSLTDKKADKNILVIGSGMSFHNMHAFGMPELVSEAETINFNNWLAETCAGDSLRADDRERRLAKWQDGPAALKCHPRPEHLLPLHVCYGMAHERNTAAEVVFSDEVMGRQVTGLLW